MFKNLREGKRLTQALFRMYIPIVLVGLPVYLVWRICSFQKHGLLHDAEVVWQWSFIHAAYEVTRTGHTALSCNIDAGIMLYQTP